MSKKIKVNDEVLIKTGKYKGKIGKVLKFINKDYIIVKDINIVKKCIKLSSNENILSGFIFKESKINISNVVFYNKKNNTSDKIKFTFVNNKKVRTLKSNNYTLDN